MDIAVLIPHEIKIGFLPDISLRVELDQGRGVQWSPLVLDGVHFDMRPGIGRVFLTWRIGFPWPERRGVPILSIADRYAETMA